MPHMKRATVGEKVLILERDVPSGVLKVPCLFPARRLFENNTWRRARGSSGRQQSGSQRHAGDDCFSEDKCRRV
jgi:hypothetical protein